MLEETSLWKEIEELALDDPIVSQGLTLERQGVPQTLVLLRLVIALSKSRQEVLKHFQEHLARCVTPSFRIE
jgi:hypothetical protein